MIIKAIAVGSHRLTTTDGSTWAAASAGFTAYGVAYSPTLDRVVYVGDGGAIVSSDDGVTWTPRTSGTTQRLDVVKWFPQVGSFLGEFWAGGGGSTGNPVLLKSADGITWTPVAHSFAANSMIHGLVYGGGGGVNRMVSVGATVVGPRWEPRIASSGAYGGSGTWVNDTVIPPLTISEGPVSDVAFDGAGTFIAPAGNGKLLRSLNGVTWSTTGAPATGTEWMHGVDHSSEAGRWVAVGENGRIVSSLNSTSWSQDFVPVGNQLRCVRYLPEFDKWWAGGQNVFLWAGIAAGAWSLHSSSYTINAIDSCDLGAPAGQWRVNVINQG